MKIEIFDNFWIKLEAISLLFSIVALRVFLRIQWTNSSQYTIDCSLSQLANCLEAFQ